VAISVSKSDDPKIVKHPANTARTRFWVQCVVSMAELRRFLRARGCTFEEGRKHTVVRLGARSAMMPRHPSKEIADGTLSAILKQLGLKGK